jgi:hypothetical protein
MWQEHIAFHNKDKSAIIVIHKMKEQYKIDEDVNPWALVGQMQSIWNWVFGEAFKKLYCHDL